MQNPCPFDTPTGMGQLLENGRRFPCLPLQTLRLITERGTVAKEMKLPELSQRQRTAGDLAGNRAPSPILFLRGPRACKWTIILTRCGSLGRGIASSTSLERDRARLLQAAPVLSSPCFRRRIDMRMRDERAGVHFQFGKPRDVRDDRGTNEGKIDERARSTVDAAGIPKDSIDQSLPRSWGTRVCSMAAHYYNERRPPILFLLFKYSANNFTINL